MFKTLPDAGRVAARRNSHSIPGSIVPRSRGELRCTRNHPEDWSRGSPCWRYQLRFFFSSPALAGEIHDAARVGDAARVEQLIATGTAVDERDRAKKTALHWAADAGHLGAAELLVAEGADVNAKDFSDQTPLHSAAYGGHEAVAELLLANGAEVNALDKQGISPLDRPINKGFAGIVKILTDAGGECGTDPYESETCKRHLGEE